MNIGKRLRGYLIRSWYFPGLILFLAAVLIAMLTYQDYGVAWDEPEQRQTGVINYNYVFNNDQSLFTNVTDYHGAAFELTLLEVEKWLHITDSRDIYLTRHLATHLFFLISAFFGYVLAYRLFGSRLIACLGFIMLAFAPRIYAHSFFNSKDIPFLSMAIFVFTFFQLAFSKNKVLYFVLLGIAAGYATGIRVMGIMYAAIVLAFLFIDLADGVIKKRKTLPVIMHMAAFAIAFCGSLYISWPYLWRTPVHHFIESYNALSHYMWSSFFLFKGQLVSSDNIPWTYFPVWFLISNPPVWLVTGFAGITWVVCRFFMRPVSFITNTTGRNFFFYLVCFFVPVMAVILLHSVIYDDWRHLYFVYPSFVLLSLYFINELINSRFKSVVTAACVIQVGFIGWFMVSSHPFQQVYFNAFVSHKPEYLRNNYDLEYWGCGYMQALEYLVAKQHWGPIKIARDEFPLANNIMMLQPADRGRILRVDQDADYKITDFRLHPADYPYQKEYTIKRLNSTILCVYKIK